MMLEERRHKRRVGSRFKVSWTSSNIGTGNLFDDKFFELVAVEKYQAKFTLS